MDPLLSRFAGGKGDAEVMTDQLELALVPDDYREEWRPDKPSCFDCAHIERPFPEHWQEPSRCMVLGRQVERAVGRCSGFAWYHGT